MAFGLQFTRSLEFKFDAFSEIAAEVKRAPEHIEGE
jgi:hypothetical protein